MTDRDTPSPIEPDDDPHGVDRDLWHVNPDGSGHDKYPPYAAFGPGTMPVPDRDDEGEEGPER